MRQKSRIEAPPFLEEALYRQEVIARRIAALGGLQDSLDQLKREVGAIQCNISLSTSHFHQMKNCISYVFMTDPS